MIEVQTVTRAFHYHGMKLADPNPEASPDTVREIYAAQYPELTNAVIEPKGIKGNEQIFEFSTSVGTKG